MKQLLAYLIVFILEVQFLSADGGNCVRYSVKINLQSNTTVTGYLVVGSFDPRFVFNDTSFFDYIKSLHYDSLVLYKDMKELQFPSYRYSYKCLINYIAIPPKSIIKLTPKEIKKIELLGYSSCDKCSNDFYRSGIPYIFELNNYEINLLNTKPIADSCFSYNAEFNPNLIWILSYNKDFGINKIMETWNNYINKIRPYIDKENWIMVNKRYLDLKILLRKNNVVIFELQYSY